MSEEKILHEIRCNANICRFNKDGFCAVEDGNPIQIMMVRRIPVCADFEDENKVIVEIPSSPNIDIDVSSP